MTAHSTMLSPEQLIDAARAPLLAYGHKDWKAVEASITPDYVYDEVATDRRVKGLDAVMAVWRGWATAFPDSVLAPLIAGKSAGQATELDGMTGTLHIDAHNRIRRDLNWAQIKNGVPAAM